MFNELSITFDKWWCSIEQLPSSILLTLDKNAQQTRMIACLRLLSALLLFFELLGCFFITSGLLLLPNTFLLLVGITLKICGGIFSSICQNKSGILWYLTLDDLLKNLILHGSNLRSLLVAKGCAEFEINSLKTLPNEIYQSELNSYRRAFFLNIGTPIATALALFIYGYIFLGIIVLSCGLITFPIGEYIYNKYTKKHETKLRHGKTAHLTSFMKLVFAEHLNLTIIINVISQLPLFLFGLFLIFGNKDLFITYYALTQGLVSMAGLLAFQKFRVTSCRTIKTASHLITALGDESFLITEHQWDHHAQKSSIKYMPSNTQTGIFIDSFEVGSNKFLISNLTIPYGKTCLLKAPSGYGKTSLLMAILHLINHRGDIFFKENETWVNTHLISRKELKNKILWLNLDQIESSDRLIDVFREIYKKYLPDFYANFLEQFGILNAELAWNSSDALMELEIEKMKKGYFDVFPMGMLDSLEKMRLVRSKILQEILKKAQGNLFSENVYPERVFATLSSGEKQRILVLLVVEKALQNQSRLVIFDEPLEHLDHENMIAQLNTIQKIQLFSSPPAMIVVSHKHQDLLENYLSISSTLYVN